MNNGNIQINGNVYAKGEGSSVQSGIILNNTKLNFKGFVSTPKDFIVNASKNTTIKGNVYCDNFKIINDGNNYINIIKDDEKYGNLFTRDDLEINGENNSINIYGGYYGLSDGSKANDNEPNNSSSIIINSDNIDNTHLNVYGDSIIMGVSYITGLGYDKSELYQTGESLSLKGNYIAYTKPLNINSNGEDRKKVSDDGEQQSLMSENINFKYLPPLILAYTFKDGTKLNYQDKSDYIYYYYLEHKNDDDMGGLNTSSNININTASSIHLGTIFDNKSGFIQGNYISDYEKKVNDKQKEYRKMVYYMANDNEIKDDDKYDTIIHKYINFDNLPDSDSQIKSNKVLDFGNGKKVNQITFLSKGSDSIALIGQNVDESSYNLPDTKIYLNSDGEIQANGLVICKGDIYIYGKVNFNGCIITDGNIYIMDGKQKIFNYDEDTVNYLIAKNYDNLKDVFINNSDIRINVPVESKYNSGFNSVVIKNKLIHISNWKIVK